MSRINDNLVFGEFGLLVAELVQMQGLGHVILHQMVTLAHHLCLI